MSTTSATSEFRPLPTPEQVRAHGDGGLWEADTGNLYKFFDRPRDEPWWDVGDDRGQSFCSHGRAWTYGKGDPRGPDSFRPLRAIGKPRPWSEIDAIAGATATPASTSATPAIVPPPGGKFQVGDVVTLHRFDSHEEFAGSKPQWAADMTRHVGQTARVDRIPDWPAGNKVCANGWTWPVERVSFVSRPTTAATATATVPHPEPVVAQPIRVAIATSGSIIQPISVQGLLASSAIVTRADSLGAEAQKQINDIARQVVADVFTRIAQEAESPTKENTMANVTISIPGVNGTTATPKTSLPATLKQELKEDGVEILYRGTARTLNREAKDLVVKYLVSQLPAKKRKGAMTMFAAAFDTEAGTALCGALLSLLPHMAAYLGKPVGPKLTRLARECRREGGTDAVARIMSELMGMLKLLTELGDKYLSSLPDEEAREVEAPSSVSAGSLPSASPVVDFSAPPEMAKVGA